MTLQGTVGEMSCRGGKQYIRWRVEHFFALSETVDNYYESPTFHFWGRSWCLRLFPNGQSKWATESYTALYLAMGHLDPPLEVHFKLGILTADGQTEVYATGIDSFEEGGRGIGTRNAIERLELWHRRHELVPDGVLTIVATLKTDIPRTVEGVRDASVQTVVEDCPAHDEKEKLQILEKTGGEKVLQDIGELWQSGDNSDVVVQVGNVEFKAHRAILGVRSPVLCAMFRHDTAEKNSGVVTISDCDPDLFEELLHYIYTGAPRELTVKKALNLYALADKYLVGDLKMQCSRCVQDTLCVDTFCDTISLALNHNDSELLEHATDFFTTNIRLILRSTQWQKFMRERTTEANELLITAHGPLED